MPESDISSSKGSRVITLSAIPESANCPFDLPTSGLIEVIQMSGPVEIDDQVLAIHVMFVYETETEFFEQQAMVSFEWYQSQFPIRLFATIPDTIEGIESTSALKEGPVKTTREDKPDDSAESS